MILLRFKIGYHDEYCTVPPASSICTCWLSAGRVRDARWTPEATTLHFVQYHDGQIVKANSPKKKKDKMASMFTGAAQRLDFGASSDQSDDEDSGEDKDNEGRQSDVDNTEEKADKDK